ncbi:MAG: tRNA (adenosine(37)-N6)-dimethylallyltransferase MiaA, partial [Planctomycetota bacterium]|nr:tRNA (adenosine(37)-N6)-dimethylallyltransferase MiaA [Planctomycetota bacterium]
EAVKQCVAEIHACGHKVLFVGGTPLYLKGLLRGIFEGPAADGRLRDELAAEAQRHGGEWLHGRLAKVDPESAGRLHPHDTRRLIRAIEVFEKTGRPISQWQEQFDRGLPAEDCRVFVLDWHRDELYARINRRVDEMFAEGLLDEVRGLLNDPKPLSKTAGQAVGYREVVEHLRGEHSLEDAIELVKMHTRRFAKRQGTWFRSLSECRFVPLGGEVDAAATARLIADMAAP